MSNPSRTKASTRDSLGFYRFRVGDFNFAVISDGALEIEPPMWAANAPDGAVHELLKQRGIDRDIWYSGLHCLLVETGSETVLIDTGAGEFAMPGSEPNAAKLIPTLERMGVDVTEIDHVIITHYHPDHVGNLSHHDKPAFPNARYHLSQTEYDYIQSADDDPFVPFARSKLAPVEASGQLYIFQDNAEPVPGFQTMPAPGHTPGHVVLMIGSGEEVLFHMVDVAPNPYVSLSHPEWHFAFDSDPDQGVTTRRELLGKAADENLLMMSYHFPFPAVGYVFRDGDGFGFSTTG